MFDLTITGATVVDGTGSPARAADVSIKDGVIAAIGQGNGPSKRTIDAAGAHVLPGFVDIHTHYDGQVTWDAELAPSALHGVTTCVMGSCGVGFAPVRKGREQELVELMEGVEDIPGSALAEGIPWGWESVAEYMAAIAAMPHAIDFLVQVPHDPLRMFVMGERAVAEEVATDADIAAMRTLLREALQAGAAGFSTGRSDNHRTARGAATPASEVDRRELVGLAEAFHGVGHGVLQAVSDFDMAVSPERFDPEFDVLEQMAVAAGRPLAISTMQRDAATDQWRRILARIDRANARGLSMHALVAPRGIGVILGLEATFHPFMGFPSYKKIASLPLAERVAHLSRPEVKAQLLSEKSEPVAGDGSPIPPLADHLLAAIDFVAMRLFRMGERPSYEPRREDSLFAESMRRGVPPLEVVYDALLGHDGRELLYFPLYNYGGYSLDDVGEMLHHPRAMVSLGDGGAHVGTICDASMFTFFLMHWARDREKARFSVEDAVRKLTSEPARWAGMVDRGAIAEGLRADLNVIDLDRLALAPPRLVHDLPAGGKRFLQDASGYRATIVRGEPITEDGRATGATPGGVVRAGRA
jgi:N-acyl-D-aspartate/D-glutamate deacylase